MTISEVISKNPSGKWKTPHLSAFRDCAYKAKRDEIVTSTFKESQYSI